MKIFFDKKIRKDYMSNEYALKMPQKKATDAVPIALCLGL
jgi:hypothetical protein